MYASGVPLGLVIDSRGPRLAILIGAVALGVGYYPIYIGLSPCHGRWEIPYIDTHCW